MKNFTLNCFVGILFICITLSTKAQNITFNDPNFRQALFDLGVDINGDGKISQLEATAFAGVLDVSDRDIADLTGIEYFTGITGLNCSVNQLSSLNLNSNTLLTELYCQENELTDLSLSQNTALQNLNCGDNQIGELNLNANTALNIVDCYNNQLTDLNLTSLISLTELRCTDNQIEELNLNQNSNLIELTCINNKLSTLNLENNVLLKSLNCANNPLTSLDISKNTALTYLSCNRIWATSLDISNNTALETLLCNNAQLTSLSFGQNTALNTISIDHNRFLFSDLKAVKNEFSFLTYTSDSTVYEPQTGDVRLELDYSSELTVGGKETTYTWYDNYGNEVGFSKVEQKIILTTNGSKTTGIFIFKQAGIYHCVMTNDYFPDSYVTTSTVTIGDALHFPDENFKQALVDNASINTNGDSEISQSEVDACTGTLLNVNYKEIKDLTGVEYFTGITTLFCKGNELTELDISQNTALQNLDCGFNELSSLNLSQNVNLTRITIPGNELHSLDLSNNQKITTISCDQNRFPFSEVKTLKDMDTDMQYTSIKKIFDPLEIKSFDEEIDYSAETVFDDKQTVFTWYNQNDPDDEEDDEEVDSTVVEETATGVFRFLKSGTYYCKMTNTHFGNSAELQTETITITESFIDFEDDTFKQALVNNTEINTNGDAEISKGEALAFTGKIDVSQKNNITDLTGIEYFTNITELDCWRCDLTSLDVSKNTALTMLSCGENQITSLILGNNTNLVDLWCYKNNLSEMDVSGVTELEKLAAYDNQLTSLNVKNNTELGWLWLHYNELSEIDLSANTKLTWFKIHYNSLTSLDVSNSTLNRLECRNNELTDLVIGDNNFSKSTDFEINGNKLPLSALKLVKDKLSMDLPYIGNAIFSPLEGVYGFEVDYTSEASFEGVATKFEWYNENGLVDDTAVEETDTPAVFRFLKPGIYYCVMSNDYISETISVKTDKITINATVLDIPDENFKQALLDNAKVNTIDDEEIFLSEALAFEGTLNVTGNEIKDLTGIGYFTNITGLNCMNNSVNSIDISQNTKLLLLECSFNNLGNLNVSNNKSLETLYCYNNVLTSLNLDENTALKALACQSNLFESLNVSKNTALENLDCFDNALTDLNLETNTALIHLNCEQNKLTDINLSKNTALISFFFGNNQFTDIDLSDNTALKQVYADNNSLRSLDLSKNTALTLVTCSNNKIPFSELKKVKDIYTYFYYTSDSTILYKQEGEYSFIVDYTTESLFEEKKTDFKWYNEADEEVDDSVVEEQETKGVFRFIQPGVYYCKMTNEHFSGAELKTETITIGENVLDIPDLVFKSYLVGNSDINQSGDQEIQFWEAHEFSGEIDLRYLLVEDLTGIEYFTNLTSLTCASTKVSSLDLSANTALQELYCDNNGLKELNLKKNIELITLDCGSNAFTELDLSTNTKLKRLICSSNKLSELDLSHNTALTFMSCYRNDISTLNVSNCLDLEHLDCYGNELKELYLGGNTNLTMVNCGSNNLTGLDLSSNVQLTNLSCNDNQLTKLEIGSNKLLTNLDCSYNQLTSLDLSENIKLEEVICSENSLSNLNVSALTALETLDCTNNPLGNLNLDANESLYYLYCAGNQLSSLDLSSNTDLYRIDCSNNQLSTLEVAHLVNLEEFNCNYNKFPFSALESIKAGFASLDYFSNKIIFTPQTGEYEHEVDYSTEVTIDGNTSSFTWYDIDGNKVVDGEGIEEQLSKGVFRFLKHGTYYCKMTNEAFPGFELEAASITINSTDQTITFTNLITEAKVNDVVELEGTASSGLEVRFEVLSGSATLNGNIITFLGEGEIELKAIQDGDGIQFLAIETTATVTVSKREQTISFDPLIEAKVSDVLELSATSTSGLEVGFEVVSGSASLNGNSITFNEEGSVVVKALQSGNTEFFPIEKPATFTVSKKAQTISFAPDTEVKINDEVELSASASSGLDVSFEVVSGNATLDGNTITFLEKGSVTVKAIQDGNTEFLPTEETATFIISQKGHSITFTNLVTEAKVNDEVELSATASSGLPLSFEILSGPATLNGNFITFNGEGSVTIRAFQGGNSEFPALETIVTITITKREQTIDFNPVTAVLVNSVVELSATSSSGLDVSFELVSGDAVLSGNTLTFFQEGMITVKALQEGNDEFMAAEQTAVIVISKQDQTISFNPDTEVSVNDVVELSATASSGLAVSFELVSGNATLDGNSITFNEEGTITIRAIQDGNDEFAATEETIEILVNGDVLSKASVSIYPNPVVDVLNITFKSSSRKTISLYNLLGKIIMQEEAFATKTINLSNQQAGMYILKIQAGSQPGSQPEYNFVSFKIMKN